MLRRRKIAFRRNRKLPTECSDQSHHSLHEQYRALSHVELHSMHQARKQTCCWLYRDQYPGARSAVPKAHVKHPLTPGAYLAMILAWIPSTAHVCERRFITRRVFHPGIGGDRCEELRRIGMPAARVEQFGAGESSPLKTSCAQLRKQSVRCHTRIDSTSGLSSRSARTQPHASR